MSYFRADLKKKSLLQILANSPQHKVKRIKVIANCKVKETLAVIKRKIHLRKRQKLAEIFTKVAAPRPVTIRRDGPVIRLVLGGPNITANLYCICFSEHETCAYADAVQICA